MSRIDWIVLSRLVSRIALTLLVFFGLFSLVESLDTWRFQALTEIGGLPFAIFAIMTGAGSAMMGTLPVTLLLGAILGILDLQARREFVMIKATGTSIWRIMRAPLVAAFLFGLFSSFVGEPALQLANRGLPVPQRSASPGLWLEQSGADGDYVLAAQHPHSDGLQLETVTLYFTAGNRDRIEADVARLQAGQWVLEDAVRYRPDAPPERFQSLGVATQTTPGDMRVRLRSARDLTFSELSSAIGQRMTDPLLRAAALTSLFRLIAMPVTLVGSMMIAFAFTAGYRRTNKYGRAVLYGIVLGFVVYVVTELASRSGSSGVLDPAFAAAGPAIVAIVIGLTVLLYKEDGRA